MKIINYVLICITPALPNPFIRDTDYSHDGIGTVLSPVQNDIERPIALNARRLKPIQSQYASHKSKLLTLIFAI